MTDGRVFDRWEGLTEAGSHTWQMAGSHRRLGLIYWTKPRSHILQKAKSHRMHGLTEGKVWQMARSHRRHRLTDGRTSQKAGFRRRQGLAECRFSDMKESRACRAFWRFHTKQGHRYERKQPLTEHKVSQNAGPHMWQIGSHRRRGHTYWTKARSHRKQGLTEGKISQKVWSHIWKKTGSRESLTEGKLWQRAGRVSQKAKSHR